ncbi:MAG: plastocyanin/azurin family copper-binding protein [Limnohabitans sp.]
MNFAQTHIATLLKYGGISFIAGAVNHGFFSEARSFWTAGFGVLFYLLGAWLDLRARDSKHLRWGDVLGFGLLSSIGLGFFTGGLQHFPDSPDRSLWVVPLGFVLSLLAMYFIDWRGQLRVRALVTYGLVSFAVVSAGSAAAWSLLQGLPPSAHSHSHGEASATAAHDHAAADEVAVRTITLTMNDDMRFSPSSWQATSGETVRIRVINQGHVRHEFVMGTEAELAAHAAEMKKQTAAHHHHSHNALSLAAGESGELLWTFTDAGVLQMACFEPGHFEAGMRGTVSVLP